MDIISTVRSLLSSTAILSVMEQGENAVLDKIAEALDGYLAVQIPAYGAAKQACAQMPGCTDRLVTMRNDLFRDYAAATGLYTIIATAVRVYKALPGPVRAVATEAAAAVGAAAGVAAAVIDADVSKAVAALADGTSFVAESPIRALEYGRDARALVGGLFTRYLGDVFATIEEVPVLGAVYTGAATLVGVASDVLDVGEDIIGGVLDVGGDVIDVVSDIGSAINPFD